MRSKSLSLAIALVLCFTMLAIAAPKSFAAEKVLEAKITNMVEATDRNGNAYIRFIVEETRMIQGVKFPVGIPVMAFGTNVDKARTLNIGDTLKAIVQTRTFNSRDSYTVLAWM